MSLLSLRRLDVDDATLLRRAHRGDRRARRLYVRRNAPRAIYLVGLLVESPAEATSLAAAALDAAVEAGIAGDDALVRAAVRVVAPTAEDSGLARLVLTLTDVDGRSEEVAAHLVGRSASEVSKLRADARAQLGSATLLGRECRGWALATRRDRLTDRERDAANGHLMLCSQCRGRLEEQRRTRDKLRISGAAISAVVVADVVSLSTPGGGMATAAFSSLAAGKTGAAVAGAAILAVGAASSGVAMVRQPRTASHSVVRHVSGTSGSATATPTDAQRAPAGVTAPEPAEKTTAVPSRSLVPTSAQTSVPRVSVPLPLSTPSVTVPLPPPVPSVTLSVPPVPTPLLSTR